MLKDPQNWRGMFYFNRKDPRLMIKKDGPLKSWTFNFASPWSIVAFAAVLVITILSLIL